jgi:hypothetical protein
VAGSPYTGHEVPLPEIEGAFVGLAGVEMLAYFMGVGVAFLT